MTIRSTIKRHASPLRAARFYGGSPQRRPPQGDEIPAMLWLWFAIIALIQVRRGVLSTRQLQVDTPEVITYALVAGAIVLAGRFMPRIVVLVLVGILVAGVLDAAPKVSTFLAGFQSRIAALGLPASGAR
jgi:hypothetical protein